ncbi:hypothetical protein GT204_31030 [Streptomyces sp. SID4919]|uniref:DUF7224 domain-containing protein n=1 Tax=unclassified Streptomyces TaxID=2593676 RepID=UPI000823D586|nr:MULTISPECIES: hypothetical protein [unclassified Streptomyces]MYY13200.1 hypothetical protein [Streptomyces sp. SID4919]SCK38513.1 hypothetical protein YW7DRAFT_03268 [Streptomyces sp. AmelKG-E11A]
MIFLGNLRASAAPWLLLPGLLGLVLYVDGDTLREAQGYAVGAGELAAFGIVAIAPMVAGAAAWEAGRHRHLRELHSVSVRGTVRRWLRAIAPVLLLHVLLVVAAVVLARSIAGVWPGGQGWWGVLHLLVVPGEWLVIGWVLGLSCPRAVAAPVAAAVPWIVLPTTHAVSAPSLRHLGGFVLEGSTLTDVRDPLVYVIPWLTTAALVVAVVLLAGTRRRPWLPVVSAAVALAALFAGRAVVADWGDTPLREPRSGHTVCEGGAPAICLPREYAGHLDEVRHAALPRLAALQEAGVPMPVKISMVSPALKPVPGTWPLSWGPDVPAEEFDLVLARSAVGGTAARQGIRDCGWPSSAGAWAMLVMGAPEAKVRDDLPDEERAEMRRVRALPADQQVDWFTSTAREQKHCMLGPS